MGKLRAVETKTTVEKAVNAACSMLEDIGNEFDEAVSAVEGTGLAESERYQSWGEARDVLQNVVEPDVPACVLGLEVVYIESPIPKSASGVASRRIRRDDAVATLGMAKAAAEEFADTTEDEAAKESATAFTGELDDIIDEVEGVDF